MTIKHNNLPDGCTVLYDEYTKRLHILFNGCYVVSKKTGHRKFLKGNDQFIWNRARRFAWDFRWNMVEGYVLEAEK